MKNERYITAIIIIILFCSSIAVTIITNNKMYNPAFINHNRFIPTTTGELNRLQWWIYNDGTFPYYYDSSNAWGKDDRKTVKGIDLNVGNKTENILQKRSLIIAIIDSGVDIYHPAISHSVFINESEIPNDSIDNDGNGYIDDERGWNFHDGNNEIYSCNLSELTHGTAIAGLLIGNDPAFGYRSVLSNYDVKILCLKVLDGEANVGSLSNIIAAIKYAEKMGAAICGLSINTFIDDPKFKEVMKTSKMLFVVSAGNEGINLDRYGDNYPTCYRLENIISVADLRCDGVLSATSNYGKKTVDIAAPGTNMLCAKPGGGYTFLSGTSLSVYTIVSEAGLIYLKMSEVPSARQMKIVILKNTASVKSLKGRVSSNGIPDFEKAINASH